MGQGDEQSTPTGTHTRTLGLTDRDRHSLRNEHGEASDKRESCKGLQSCLAATQKDRGGRPPFSKPKGLRVNRPVVVRAENEGANDTDVDPKPYFPEQEEDEAAKLRAAE